MYSCGLHRMAVQSAVRIDALAQNTETPRMSATPYPPTGFPGSTFGEAGLNFRVRNGTG